MTVNVANDSVTRSPSSARRRKRTTSRTRASGRANSTAFHSCTTTADDAPTPSTNRPGAASASVAAVIAEQRRWSREDADDRAPDAEPWLPRRRGRERRDRVGAVALTDPEVGVARVGERDDVLALVPRAGRRETGTRIRGAAGGIAGDASVAATRRLRVVAGQGAQRMDELTVDVGNGRALGYREYGAPDGRPVVNCHGGLVCGLDVASYGDAARDLGVRIISPDRPGIASSDPAPGSHHRRLGRRRARAPRPPRHHADRRARLVDGWSVRARVRGTPRASASTTPS